MEIVKIYTNNNFNINDKNYTGLYNKNSPLLIPKVSYKEINQVNLPSNKVVT